MFPVVINSQNYTDYSYIIPYIRYYAEDRYHSEWVLKQRKINDYELIFITAGTGRFTVEDRIYNVKSNDIVLFKPGVFHKGISVNLPFAFLCIHFNLYVSRAVNKMEVQRHFIYESVPSGPVEYNRGVLDFPEYSSANNFSYIKQLIKKILHEGSKKLPGYNTVIKSLFTELIFNLFRQRQDIKSKQLLRPEIQAIIDYVKKNYVRGIKLTDLANQIHLQPSYISSLFKKYSGYTITEFIKMHRLAAAKRLLLETDHKIEYIARSTGFYDTHHFSRVFKESEGLAPGQFRETR